MSGNWLEITDAKGTRREPLREGLTRVGSGTAEIHLDGVAGDQLHVWNRPPRAVFVGEGTPPQKDGAPFEEIALRSGDEIRWAGATLRYTGEAAPATPASLEELPVEAATTSKPSTPDVPGSPAGSRGEHERIWRRLVAGMMVELDMTDRSLVKRWQRRVVDGEFEVDRCARELFEAGTPRMDELRLLERSGRLLRDFLMAPLARGARGAGRRARRATKSGMAFLVAQLIAIGVYSLILVLIMAFLWKRGVRFDAMFEGFLSSG